MCNQKHSIGKKIAVHGISLNINDKKENEKTFNSANLINKLKISIANIDLFH